MPAKASPPETQEFRLDLLDSRQGVPTEEKTTVTIRLATIRQNALRGRLFSEVIREPADQDGNKERIIYRLPLYDLVTEEVFLTLVGCNMTTADGKKSLFRFKSGPNGDFLDMTREQFEDAWGILDDDTAVEIHSKVIEQNPHWKMGSGDDVNLGE